MNEEDTVTVGQDLVRIESGGAPAPKDESTTKADDKPTPSTESEPSQQQKQPEPKQETKQATKQESKPQSETAPAPSQRTAAEKKDTAPSASQGASTSGLGSREERRVCFMSELMLQYLGSGLTQYRLK